MQLARVCGQIISTRKAEKLVGFKILVCQPIDMVTFEEKGAPFVAIDSVGAGDGELVMCVNGSSSRQTALTDARPVDCAIVAIIDSVDILGERCFDKADPDVKPAAAKKQEEKKPAPAKEKPAVKEEKKPEAKKEPEKKAENIKEAPVQLELTMMDIKPKTAEKTEAKAEKPKAQTSKPKTETKTDKPKTAGGKPKAKTSKPKTEAKPQVKPETKADKPKAEAEVKKEVKKTQSVTEKDAQQIVEDILKELDEKDAANKDNKA